MQNCSHVPCCALLARRTPDAGGSGNRATGSAGGRSRCGNLFGRWGDHVDALVGALANVKHVFFAGRGSSLAAVGLGAMCRRRPRTFTRRG